MKKPRNIKYEIKSEINIVPFLDILLVLLIIFMMMPSKLFIQQKSFTAQFSHHELTKDNIKNNKLLITIKILGTGIYDLTIGNNRISNISSDQIISEIYSIKITNPNVVCLIAASEEEKYHEIVQILNILNKIGINSIGMTTNSTNTTN